ncbi:MAG: (d)CMP kinase [Candidatus Limnocylindrales bacterium]
MSSDRQATPAPPARLPVVAIDGPSSSGKSTVGAEAARRLRYRFCDTGLLYRAVTWLALQRGVAATDAAAVVPLAAEVHLLADARGRLRRVEADGRDVTREVRRAVVDRSVSDYSRVPELRAALVARQRAIAAEGGIIMAGRDIGTVILPDADVKIFLDASAEERARRRAAQRRTVAASKAQQILDELKRRDAIDSSRETAALKAAPDAILVQTEGITLAETVALVVRAIRDAEARLREAPVADGSGPVAGVATAGRHLPFFPRFSGAVLRVVAACLTRVRLEGAANIPSDGPLLVICNHASNADGMLLMGYVVPAMRRPMRWLGKEEALRWPLFGWGMRQNGVFGVRRGAGDLEAFKLAKSVLDEGGVLTVFPEGTRSPDGALREAKEGATVLAVRSTAPILPIAIVGAQRFWPKGKLFPRPGRRMTVRVGETFTLSMPKGPDRHESLRLATVEMMRHVAELLPPEQQGVYAEAVGGVGHRDP